MVLFLTTVNYKVERGGFAVVVVVVVDDPWRAVFAFRVPVWSLFLFCVRLEAVVVMDFVLFEEGVWMWSTTVGRSSFDGGESADILFLLPGLR